MKASWFTSALAHADGNAFMTALGLITPQDLSEAGLELPDFADSELVGLTATAVHTGVARDDVLFQADNYFDNGLMNPGHLVAVDHSRNAVVLAFRGTSNLDVSRQHPIPGISAPFTCRFYCAYFSVQRSEQVTHLDDCRRMH